MLNFFLNVKKRIFVLSLYKSKLNKCVNYQKSAPLQTLSHMGPTVYAHKISPPLVWQRELQSC